MSDARLDERTAVIARLNELKGLCNKNPCEHIDCRTVKYALEAVGMCELARERLGPAGYKMLRRLKVLEETLKLIKLGDWSAVSSAATASEFAETTLNDLNNIRKTNGPEDNC